MVGVKTRGSEVSGPLGSFKLNDEGQKWSHKEKEERDFNLSQNALAKSTKNAVLLNLN